MSSFYGNIKFNNQTPLIFDKIYTSRRQMELDCHSDGIFNGRFVLISYGDIQYTPYHKLPHLGRPEFEKLIDAGYSFYVPANKTELKQYPDGFKPVKKEDYHTQEFYYVWTDLSIDNTSTFSQNQSLDEQYYNHDYHNTVWQKIWTSTQDSENIEEKYIMVSHLNAETPKITMIVDAPNDVMEFDESNKIYYLVPTDESALNQTGYMSEEDFEKFKTKLYVKNPDADKEQPVDPDTGEQVVPPSHKLVTELNLDWDIHTEYYILEHEVYVKFSGSTPYVDGMISEGLYIDITQNREIPLFILDANNEYQLSTGWEELNKYYFMRYRTTDGRPHFDPLMSTDLDYKFHMPRNWKWDNNLDFEYNIEGFEPTKARYTNTQENKITIIEKTSGDVYPIHRADEPSAAVYELKKNEFNESIFEVKKTEQPDTKRFQFDLSKLGDAVSNMWDKIYPRIEPENSYSERDVYIGNDRLRPNNDQENYPETVAEAIRKLYYWLGLKDEDNNFKYGPWVDPKTREEVDTIFGVLNGASDLLGDIGDHFDENLFIPVASPYYPDGYGRLITDDGFKGLGIEEFKRLNNGGAGPLYVRLEDGSYIQAIDFGPEDKTWEGYTRPEIQNWDGYDKEIQYYRNMNSLFALLYEWQDIVKDCQADWTFDKGHIEWDQNNPMHPRFIKNKPIVLSVDQTEDGEFVGVGLNKENINDILNKYKEIYRMVMDQNGNYTYLKIDDIDSFINTLPDPPSMESPYAVKHIKDTSSINWYWENYAL